MKKLDIFEMQKVNGGRVIDPTLPISAKPKKNALPSGMTRWIEYVLEYCTPAGYFCK